MKSFRFNAQSAMYFGRNCVKENAQFFKAYGQRAVVFTGPILSGRVSGTPHISVADVKETLETQGIDYLVVDGVEIDPPVEVCAELAKQAGEFHADFFVAVGGGSVIDSCKAAAVLLDHPEESDPYKVLYTPVDPALNIKTQAAMPIIAVPTTAGTGSDFSGYAVLTRKDTDNKQRIAASVYCTAAFLDSRYIQNSPDFLIHTGVFDALAHGVESYLNKKHSTMNRMFGEYGFKLFASFKDHLLSGELTDEDFEKITLHSYIQGMAFSSTEASTIVPHGMGYPLSHVKHVNHGLSCAIFLAEYVRGFKDQSMVQPIVEMCGFKNSDEFAEYCKTLINRHVDIEVTNEEIEYWSDQFMLTRHIKDNPEKLERDDVVKLYKLSLASYIK